MAKTKQVKLNDDGTLGVDTDAPEDADELRALAELDAGGDITFQVIRVMPVINKGFVGSLSSPELTLEKIQQEFGKGRYRVRGIRANGQYVKQTMIDIATDARGAAPAAPPPAAPAAAPGFASIQEYIAMEEAREQKRSNSIREWVAILAPLGTAIIPAIIGNKGPTLAELSTTLTNMKALAGGNESSLGKVEEIAKLIDAVKGIGGSDEKTGSTWVDLIRDVAKELGPALGAIVATKLPGISAPALPNPAAARPQLNPTPAPAPAQPPKEADEMAQLLTWLREQLEGLVHQAKKNSDPALYADVVLDNLPDGVDPALLKNFLAKPDWWASLTMFYSAVRPYGVWFTECRKHLLTGLDEMISAPTETPSGNGVANPLPFDDGGSIDD
jgi:hypothetical protein